MYTIYLHIHISDDMQPLVSHTASDQELITIYETIRAGARAFLWAEYQVCVCVCVHVYYHQ